MHPGCIVNSSMTADCVGKVGVPELLDSRHSRCDTLPELEGIVLVATHQVYHAVNHLRSFVDKGLISAAEALHQSILVVVSQEAVTGLGYSR